MECRTTLCVLFLHLCVSVFGYATVYDIDNWCDMTLTVDDALRIKLRSYSWPTQRSCAVTLSGSSIYHSDSSTRILARFLSIGLSTGLAGSCSKSRVDIIDSDGSSILSDSTGTCGYSLPFMQPYKSTGNTMIIRLKRTSTFTQSGSFSLLATQFTTGICDSFGEFSCTNGRCIDDDLTCDGYNNCGDNSDEYSCGLGSGASAGVAVGCIFFFIFFLLLITAVYRRRTYGRILWTSNPYNRGLTTVSHTTTTATTTGAVVAPVPYGVQQPAPVYTAAAPPPPYPGTQYPGPQGTYPS